MRMFDARTMRLLNANEGVVMADETRAFIDGLDRRGITGDERRRLIEQHCRARTDSTHALLVG